jgi:tetratricopeptide (TPR) repeat protein
MSIQSNNKYKLDTCYSYIDEIKHDLSEEELKKYAYLLYSENKIDETLFILNNLLNINPRSDKYFLNKAIIYQIQKKKMKKLWNTMKNVLN